MGNLEEKFKLCLSSTALPKHPHRVKTVAVRQIMTFHYLLCASFCVSFVYSAPADHNLGERVFLNELKEDRKFVSDPSAKSDGRLQLRSRRAYNMHYAVRGFMPLS